MEAGDAEELARLRARAAAAGGGGGGGGGARRRPGAPPASAGGAGGAGPRGGAPGAGEFDPAAFGLPASFGGAPRRAAPVVPAAPRGAAGAGARGGGDESRGGGGGASRASPPSAAQPSPPPAAAPPAPAAGGGDREGGSRGHGLPVSHEVRLQGAGKTVTCVAVDPPGARALVGGLDYCVRMYDFQSMRRDFKAFRSVEPFGSHALTALSWSPSGDRWLGCAACAQFKVFDREGREQWESPRGDMYIRDSKNTRGHAAGVAAGQWNPDLRGCLLTAGEDGTLRLWELSEGRGEQAAVVKPKLARPGRVGVGACAWALGGAVFAGGVSDGSVQLFDSRAGESAAVGLVPAPRQQMVRKQTWKSISRPRLVLGGAHAAGEEVTGLAFHPQGADHLLLSRSSDGTLKLWDLRKGGGAGSQPGGFSAAASREARPLHSFEGLPNRYSGTACGFSPAGGEKAVFTACSAGGDDGRGEGGGGLKIFSAETFEELVDLPVTGSAVAATWHPKLDQIFVGAGGRDEGTVAVFYDGEAGSKPQGVAAGAGKQAKRMDAMSEILASGVYRPKVYEPHNQQGRGGKRGHTGAPKVGPDPSLGGAAPPGRGRQGVLGSTKGTLLTQHVVAQAGGVRKWEDPREALLKFDDGREAVYTAAYKETQPEPRFEREEVDARAGAEPGAEGGSDSPDAQRPAKARRIDPRTGLYMPE